MRLSGPAVLEALSGDDDLLDSVLTRFEISGEPDVSVTMEFQGRHTSRYGRIALRFEDVIECVFYHRWDHIFFNVAHLKFLTTSGGAFYLSLDPYDASVPEPVDEDGCCVKARVIAAELTHR